MTRNCTAVLALLSVSACSTQPREPDFKLERNGKIDVLIIRDAAENSFEDPAFFARTALTMQGMEPEFRVELAEPSTEINWKDFDIVFVIGVARPNEMLVKFAGAGGALVLAPGPATDPGSWNDTLRLPAKLGDIRDKPGRTELGRVPDSLKTLKDVPANMWKGPGYNKAYELDGATEDSILLRFPDGPALVLADRVALFASTLDATWNEFPAHPTYMIVLRELVEHLCPEGTGR